MDPTQTRIPSPEPTTLARLEQRLSDVHDIIEKRRERGIDTEELEMFWEELMHQYKMLLKGQS